MRRRTLFVFIGIVVLAVFASSGFIFLQNKNVQVLNTKTAKSDLTADVGVTTAKDNAIRQVRALSEVVSYEAMLAKSGKKATIEVEDSDGEISVHVYEIVVDGEGSHTATFGWYTVDKTTGRVQKDL